MAEGACFSVVSLVVGRRLGDPLDPTAVAGHALLHPLQGMRYRRPYRMALSDNVTEGASLIGASLETWRHRDWMPRLKRLGELLLA